MNRFCSMFSQILQLFPRSDFELLVRETKTERHARGFSCWDQSMMFCQSCVIRSGPTSAITAINDFGEKWMQTTVAVAESQRDGGSANTA